MNERPRFDLIYAPQVKGHVRAIERKYHSLIRRTVETQLQFEPDVETRNKKPLRRPSQLGAEWEVRFGPENRFRVFYTVEPKEHRVLILAIGTKKRNRLVVGEEEVDL
jgi:mRNA-degrading endonuclease RelE of RelBE toxin-antitoxin system